MPWQTTPPIHFPIIAPIAQPAYNEAITTFLKVPDTSLYTAADPAPRTPTHRVVSGPCSTNPDIRAAQQTAVDAFLAEHATEDHPNWGIDPETGVAVGKYALGSANPYTAMLAAMGLTTSSA